MICGIQQVTVKSRRFCSQACRQKGYRLRKAGLKPMYESVVIDNYGNCATCGSDITMSFGRKYCSNYCKLKKWRQKHLTTDSTSS
jgi:predicted nucleic acid-binding Zn ribbon protein